MATCRCCARRAWPHLPGPWQALEPPKPPLGSRPAAPARARPQRRCNASLPARARPQRRCNASLPARRPPAALCSLGRTHPSRLLAVVPLSVPFPQRMRSLSLPSRTPFSHHPNFHSLALTLLTLHLCPLLLSTSAPDPPSCGPPRRARPPRCPAGGFLLARGSPLTIVTDCTRARRMLGCYNRASAMGDTSSGQAWCVRSCPYVLRLCKWAVSYSFTSEACSAHAARPGGAAGARRRGARRGCAAWTA